MTLLHYALLTSIVNHSSLVLSWFKQAQTKHHMTHRSRGNPYGVTRHAYLTYGCNFNCNCAFTHVNSSCSVKQIIWMERCFICFQFFWTSDLKKKKKKSYHFNFWLLWEKHKIRLRCSWHDCAQAQTWFYELLHLFSNMHHVKPQ